MIPEQRDSSSRVLLAVIVFLLVALSLWILVGRPSGVQAQNLLSAPPRMKAVGSLNHARAGAASVTLADGSVLVAGGIDGNFNYLSSAELYNPTLQRFTALPSMTMARAGHTMTLLSNGQVLIAGGVVCNGSNCSELSSAEIYDPTIRQFFAAGNMTTARGSHTATLLGDGTVLVAGGFNGEVISSAEIYNPANGRFTETATMTTPRFLHTATLLPDGGVLVAGGRSCEGAACLANSASHTTEVYDPGRRQFFATGNLGEARTLHTATLLQDGRVLIAGGRSCSGDCEGSTTLQDASIYDPATGEFAAGGNMSTPRAGQKSIALPDGDVFVYGGADCSRRFGCRFFSNGDLFQPASDNFTPAGSGTVGGIDLTMSLVANEQVLIAGGAEGGSISKGANVFSFPAN